MAYIGGADINIDIATLNSKLTNLSEDTTPQLGGDLDTNGNNINFGDNVKAQFGASNDLQIYHDGSNSYIDDAGTGNIWIRGDNYITLGSKLSGDVFLQAKADDYLKLYYDNSAKLSTTSTGIDVTGSLSANTNLEATNLYVTSSGDTGTNGISGGFKHGGINSKSVIIEADPNNVGAATRMQFNVDGTERMRIDSSGNVGIGTSSPANKLHVNGVIREGEILEYGSGGMHYVATNDNTDFLIATGFTGHQSIWVDVFWGWNNGSNQTTASLQCTQKHDSSTLWTTTLANTGSSANFSFYKSGTSLYLRITALNNNNGQHYIKTKANTNTTLNIF